MEKNHIVTIKSMKSEGMVEEFVVTCTACDLYLSGVPAPEAERASERYHEIKGTRVKKYRMC